MERYTLEERIEIIKIHYKSGEHLAGTVRKTRTFLGRREATCRTAIKKLLEKFELLGQVSDMKNKTSARRSRTDENIAAVAESIEKSQLNGLRYREMINNFLWPKLDSIDLENANNETIDLLREKFPDRVISRRGDHN